MSRNPFILAKLQKIRDNAAQRRRDKRINTLSQNDKIYREPTNKKRYTSEQIELVKKNYQKQVLAEKRKTIWIWVLTLLITPFICYLLIVWFFSDVF